METQVTAYLGHNLRTTADPLVAVAIADLVGKIRTDDRLRRETESLRNLLRMDPRAYKQSKPNLPYFCGSGFRQDHRKIEHFEAATLLTFDVDWGATDVRQAADVRARTYADAECLLGYVTPSGQGWRLVYALAEPITDVRVFKLVYKRMFAELLRRHPDLRGLDEVTHDPTRANFLAHDPGAHYFPLALPVAWGAWVNEVSPSVWGTEVPTQVDTAGPPVGKTTGRQATLSLGAQPSAGDASGPPASPPYRDIRRVLSPPRGGNTYTQRAPGRPFAPPELLEMIPAWSAALKAAEVTPVEEQRIPYGIKLLVSFDRRQATVNLFYGKRGFRIVVENRRGTDADLGAQVVTLLEDVAYETGIRPAGLEELVDDGTYSFFASSAKPDVVDSPAVPVIKEQPSIRARQSEPAPHEWVVEEPVASAPVRPLPPEEPLPF